VSRKRRVLLRVHVFEPEDGPSKKAAISLLSLHVDEVVKSNGIREREAEKAVFGAIWGVDGGSSSTSCRKC